MNQEPSSPADHHQHQQHQHRQQHHQRQQTPHHQQQHQHQDQQRRQQRHHHLHSHYHYHPHHQMQYQSSTKLNDRALTPASPCFVHAHLDPVNNRSASLSRTQNRHERSRSRHINPPLSAIPDPSWPSPGLSPNTPRPHSITITQPMSNMSLLDHTHSTSTAPNQLTSTVHSLHDGPHHLHPYDDNLNENANENENDTVYDVDDDDIENHESVTLQLAQTATSVREISKQLGRTRIKSNIQSVLIITKARDNHLVRLTRQLVISLAHPSLQLTSPDQSSSSSSSSSSKHDSHSLKPLVIYVDQQLRNSSRFDRAGLERDYPEWFFPLSPHHHFQRRLSRTTSTSSLNSIQSNRSSWSSASNSTAESSIQDEGRLRYWTPEMCVKSPELFDIVITLGGDGTVLFASWLFQRIVPPIIPFALGSLGFLTNFNFGDHQKVFSEAIKLGLRINLRMRFCCTVYRTRDGPTKRRAVRSAKTGEIFMNVLGRTGWESIENGSVSSSHHRDIARSAPKDDKEIACFSTYSAESFEVLNELVVDRGPSPYVSLLELFGDEHHMTTVQADGLTVSTPTGSTAYSLSAGGSLAHPEIPAMLITPICPHTLSFRPMLLPDTMELRICVPYASRSTAWASFDGRGRVELHQGDHVKVTASAYPFPTVCDTSQSIDWFSSISRTLKWNERERQKSFVVVEEDSEIRGTRASSSSYGSDEEKDDSEEIEQYDIDDLSTEISAAETVHHSRSNHYHPSCSFSSHHKHGSDNRQRNTRADTLVLPKFSTSDTLEPTASSRDLNPLGFRDYQSSPPTNITPLSPSLRTSFTRVVPKSSNPSLKTFAVWGVDSSSSSEGDMSDC